MPSHVVLDAGPLSLVTQRRKKSAEADACRIWMENLILEGVRIYVPEIADYEVRRELIRAGKTFGVQRMDVLKGVIRYIPITTEAMLTAANLWSQIRNAGLATADDRALDGDVILAAQVLQSGIPMDDIVIATTNVRHIARFVPADLWTRITA